MIAINPGSACLASDIFDQNKGPPNTCTDWLSLQSFSESFQQDEEMLGCKLLKPAWDKAACLVGPLRASSKLLKHVESARLFDQKLHTSHLSQCLADTWCTEKRSVSVSCRYHGISQPIELCMTKETTLAESCHQAHCHYRKVSQNHIVQTPGSHCPYYPVYSHLSIPFFRI